MPLTMTQPLRQSQFNMLARINRELNGDFDSKNFGHRALDNRERTASRMQSVSKSVRRSAWPESTVEFRRGETIPHRNSYK